MQSKKKKLNIDAKLNLKKRDFIHLYKLIFYEAISIIRDTQKFRRENG